jgi:hypothetical protein
MSQDISGYGLELLVKASNTFPIGFTVTQFADDSDPLDMPSFELADKGININGDLITWAKGNVIVLNVSVIADSQSDINFRELANANRVGKGKRPAKDVITITALYPNGRAITYSQGAIANAPPDISVTSSGRFKSNTYMFYFESKNGN